MKIYLAIGVLLGMALMIFIVRPDGESWQPPKINMGPPLAFSMPPLPKGEGTLTIRLASQKEFRQFVELEGTHVLTTKFEDPDSPRFVPMTKARNLYWSTECPVAFFTNEEDSTMADAILVPATPTHVLIPLERSIRFIQGKALLIRFNDHACFVAREYAGQSFEAWKAPPTK